MSDGSKIEWTDATWNCVTGCTEVSPGCDHCYAKTFAERWRGTPGHHFERGFDVTLRPERMYQPLRWRKPRRIFVNSMSDLFHDGVPTRFIAEMFAVMAMAPQHTFQVLTKRHGRMRSLLNSRDFWCEVGDYGRGIALAKVGGEYPASGPMALAEGSSAAGYWECASPLPNVWLGVSAEDQKWLDVRLPALLDTPAAVRFLSAEPLLGPLRIPFVEEFDGCTCGTGPSGYYGMHERGCGTMPGPAWGNLHWVIAGGESGPGARPCERAWLRSLRRQCAEAGTPLFIKQVGSVLGRQIGAGAKGGDWDFWSEDLRIRQFPQASEAVSA